MGLSTSRSVRRNWCERHDVGHITGIARNPRITDQSQELPDESRERHEQDREKRRRDSGYHSPLKPDHAMA